MKFFQKSIAIFTLLMLLIFSPLHVLAADTEITTGTNESTGIQSPVGPQEPTGPQEPNLDIINNEVILEATAQNQDSLEQPDILSSENDSTNNQTGANSENIGSTNTDNISTIDTVNDTEINNNSDLDANTGKNEIGANTVAGNVTTGDIRGTETIINAANTHLAPGSSIGAQTLNSSGINQLQLLPSTQRILFENQDTGFDSLNTNNLDSDNIIKFTDTNLAELNNGIEIDANTGENTVDRNTKVGNLTTGDIDLGVNLLNMANLYMPNMLLTADVWNLVGDLNGNIIFDPSLSNLFTGSDSTNINNVNQENNFRADITQNADLSNQFNYNLNTGENTLANNTVSGDLQTGAANLQSNLYNLANITDTPMYYILNVFGTWTGSLIGIDPSRVIINQINDTTGANSTNENSLNEENSTDIEINNDAEINNKIDINANTGKNKINNNTIVGDIETGDINLATTVVNIANTISEKVGKFALGIINIFGNWNGNGTTNPENPKPPVSKTKNKKTKKAILASTTSIETATEIDMNGFGQASPQEDSKKIVFGVDGKGSFSEDNSNLFSLNNNGATNTNISNTSETSGNITNRFPVATVLAIVGLILALSWVVLELIIAFSPKKSEVLLAINKNGRLTRKHNYHN